MADNHGKFPRVEECCQMISAMFLHDAFALRLFPIFMQRDNTFQATYIYTYDLKKFILIRTRALMINVHDWQYGKRQFVPA